MKLQINKQSGAALAICLILLLVLTLVVMSTSQNMALQEKMAAAVRDSQVSLTVAESGLVDGGLYLESLTGTTGFQDDGTDGLYTEGNGPVNPFSADWSSDVTMTANVSGQTVSYYIEMLGLFPVTDDNLSDINMVGYGQNTGAGDVNGFKIVARSTGVSGDTERIVIGLYGKRF